MDVFLNKCTAAGNLAEDPREHVNANDKKSWYATMLINRRYKVGDEQREDVTRVPLRTSDPNFAKMCQKGTNVFVEARFNTYTTGTGDDKQFGHVFDVVSWTAISRLRAKEGEAAAAAS